MSFDKGHSHLTAEQWAKRLPLIQAFIAGKQLQVEPGGDGVWRDADPGGHYSFCCPERWRIKPEPQLRPWTPAEVPVGAVVRSTREPHRSTAREMIISVLPSGALVAGPSVERVPVDRLLAAYEWVWPAEAGLPDIAWRPCGVAVAEVAP
jgi:hypothetical protein